MTRSNKMKKAERHSNMVSIQVDDGRWCRVQCRGMVSSCNLPWGDSTMVQLSGTLLGAPRADTKVGCQDIQAVWTSPHAAHLCDTTVYKARTVHLALWVPLSPFEFLWVPCSFGFGHVFGPLAFSLLPRWSERPHLARSSGSTKQQCQPEHAGTHK